MAGAVGMEASLPGTSAIVAQLLLSMHNKKMFDIESEAQSDAGEHPQ